MDNVDIFVRSSARGLQSKYGGRKWRYSTSIRENNYLASGK